MFCAEFDSAINSLKRIRKLQDTRNVQYSLDKSILVHIPTTILI